MKTLHQNQQTAILSPDKKTRDIAIDRLAEKNDVSGLIRVLGSRYADAVERAEIALSKYQFI